MSALTKPRAKEKEEQVRWKRPLSHHAIEQEVNPFDFDFDVDVMTTCSSSRMTLDSVLSRKIKQTGTISNMHITCPRCDHVDVVFDASNAVRNQLIVMSPVTDASCTYMTLASQVRTAKFAPPTFISFDHNVGHIYRHVGLTTEPRPVAKPSELPLAPEIAKALKSYEELNHKNWDGYNAEPIEKQTIEYARKLMFIMPKTFGLPDISPGGDGCIALEWHPEGGSVRKLFLDIGPGEIWRAYWKHRDDRFDRLEGSGFGIDAMMILEGLFERLSR